MCMGVGAVAVRVYGRRPRPDSHPQTHTCDWLYKRWLAARDKVKALHEAELVLLHKRRQQHGAAHPLFWAACIAMGDPR